MKNRMKKYLNEMRELDKKKKKLTKEELSDMLIHIKFYQHERLIHLLVTIFVGLGTIMFFGIAISNEMLALDRKSTRLNSSHPTTSRMPSSA